MASLLGLSTASLVFVDGLYDFSPKSCFPSPEPSVSPIHPNGLSLRLYTASMASMVFVVGLYDYSLKGCFPSPQSLTELERQLQFLICVILHVHLLHLWLYGLCFTLCGLFNQMSQIYINSFT